MTATSVPDGANNTRDTLVILQVAERRLVWLRVDDQLPALLVVRVVEVRVVVAVALFRELVIGRWPVRQARGLGAICGCVGGGGDLADDVAQLCECRPVLEDLQMAECSQLGDVGGDPAGNEKSRAGRRVYEDNVCFQQLHDAISAQK